MAAPGAGAVTPSPGITPFQKTISAMGGAVVTMLITTPLEVVKTRLQTVLPAAGAAARAGAAGAGAADAAGGAATSAATLRATTSAAARPPAATALATMLAVARMEGLPALWSGLVPGLLMQLPSTALYFTAYDELKERLEQGARARRGGGPGEATPAVGPTLLAVSALAGKDGEFAPLISGVLSRTLTVTLVSPLELLRTKAMYKGGGGRSAGGMGESVRAELKAGGVASLWRGLGPTLARDVPFSGIYWYGYERIKKRATTAYLAAEGGGGGGAPPPAPPLEISAGANWAVSFVAGLISGSVAAVLTTPFDVVKTRKQVQLYAARASGGGGGGGGGGVAGGTAVGTAAPALPTSIPAIMRTIFREEGLRGLFAGVQMRLARVGPACALMISSYEVGKRVFGNGGGAAGAELAVAAVLDE